MGWRNEGVVPWSSFCYREDPMRVRQFKISFIVVLFFILFQIANATSAQPEMAPSWEGTEWINLPAGKKTLDVKELRGRVVYLSFFQKW
jgi:hypothetical protein